MQSEQKILDEFELRDNQLRNIHHVMSSSMPKKKLKNFEDNILPGYVQRRYNARQRALKILKKNGISV